MGGTQGMVLCFFLYKRGKINRPAYLFFLICLFSVSIFNLEYTLINQGINTLFGFSLAAFPLPYKYLIGVGFYFYVKSHFSTPTGGSYVRRESYLFLPALIYGAVRLYWFYLFFSGENPQIIREVYDTGFFTVNELVYLGFDVVLATLVLRFLYDQRAKSGTAGSKKVVNWLTLFSFVFLGFTVFHLLIILGEATFNYEDYRLFYYPVLILNSIFIYWIGYVGFRGPDRFFSRVIPPKTADAPAKLAELKEKLRVAMEEEEVYCNPQLTLAKLAKQLNLPQKELSAYINEHLYMDFPEYLNQYRTEKAKQLLTSDLAEKYTILALAKEAGFNSKSTFNEVFKRNTGLTPSQFRKTHR